ncbi:MAG TPA: dTMP kinase [Bryobacteraceae bacterium]|nr:dTMP kinase [Bryobacteraceae bacterium]
MSTTEAPPQVDIMDSLEPLARRLGNGVTRRRGFFITFEGIDGAGKSTQLKLLAARLRAAGKQVLETAEPGGTSIGMQVRRILLDPANPEISAMAELLLLFACRTQNVQEAILPALDQGLIVLCDRFTDSTVAYQSAARGLPLDTVLAIDRIACEGLCPHLTLYLDIDVDTALARTRERNLEDDAPATRIEQQTPEFHGRVRDAYLDLAATQTERIRLVDGTGTQEQVADRIWGLVSRALSSR